MGAWWTHRKVNAINIALAFCAGIALGVWAPCARAQVPLPVCWPDVAAFPVSVSKAQSGQVVAFRQIVYSASATGLAYGWACVEANQTSKSYVIAGTWSQYVPDWLSVAESLARASDEARAAAWTARVTSTQIDAAMKPYAEAVLAALPKVAAPAPQPAPAGDWIVAPTSICSAQDKDASGKCVRRQAFAWDGSARGALTQDRATVGQPCITTIGISPYFGFDAAKPDRVVACVKR